MNKFQTYKKDLDRLIERGEILHISMRVSILPEEKEKLLAGTRFDEEDLVLFLARYEPWYSEAHSLVKIILPNRLHDFEELYRSSKNRSKIEPSNYTVSDFLRNVRSNFGAGPLNAFPVFTQQLSIVKALPDVFKSSLFDVKNLVQADLLDGELHSAEELVKNGYYRAAGVVAGVVLEAHLKGVCDRHSISLRKKNPSISDFNEALKAESVIEVPEWRRIQLLGDLRNKCGHKQATDPSKDNVEILISGVSAITKTIF